MTYQYDKFDQALQLLNGRLVLATAPRFNLVVCGGSALAATGLVTRTTKDVDVVALMDDKGVLLDPAPLPQALVRAAHEVALDLGLQKDWLNNGPSSGDGGLFRLGLPEGFVERLTWVTIGERLTIGFISRYDQIHFKLYAAVDQSGSYHAEDLRELHPSDAELLDAAGWTRTHDPSEGYRQGLQWFLQEFGYGHLVDRV
jgi:Nucleotidyltransferase of unknown function (DUF6036)